MECWKRKLGRLRKETEVSVLPVSDMTCIVSSLSSLSSSPPLSLSLLPGRLPKLTDGWREAEAGPGSHRLISQELRSRAFSFEQNCTEGRLLP